MDISVLLISKSEYNLNLMKNLMDYETVKVVGESSGGSAALNAIETLSPDIIVMTLGAGDTDVLSLTERIILNKPRSLVILLVESMDVEILQSAMRAGAHNIIQYPKSEKEFGEYIKTVYNNEKTRLESLSGEQKLTWMSQVITVFGSKGGLGKTTIAVNLAVKLAESRKKVALVDLDLQFGDVHLFLDIEPTDTISELSQELSDSNIDLIRSFMTVHSSGVNVLCAPKSPEYAELVQPEKVQLLLNQLRTYYDYVIIDTPPYFNDVLMTAIELSSQIMFVTGLDISILKNTKLSISLLESLNQTEKIKLIVNRAEKVSSISLDDVRTLTDCPIWAKITSDYKVAVAALNRGIPFVTGTPNCELSYSLSTLAGLLLGREVDIGALSKKQRKKLGIESKKMSRFMKIKDDTEIEAEA